MHYLLIYDFVPDYVERRGQFRDEHLKLAWEANQRGELRLAGALTDPVDSAILWFEGDSPAAAERFVKNDPYFHNGLVRSWRVRQWTTVVGEQANTPVRPA
ncbi:MAG TPA: YciI-like protein [Povalibacter sp.]|nr:YciI-like protein [Povalibacter sp.]